VINLWQWFVGLANIAPGYESEARQVSVAARGRGIGMVRFTVRMIGSLLTHHREEAFPGGGVARGRAGAGASPAGLPEMR
jgi:hypothetical protein